MQLDLNLLTVLDALLEEGSVTGAAQRLRLSSPAVSRSLGRLRRLTGDDILVRTGRTMTPTPYATAVRQRVAELLRQSREVLTPRGALDPSTLDRVFTLQCHDALATAVAPVLLADIAERAPGVRIRFLAESALDTDELRHGRVDLEIGATLPATPGIRHETVGHDRFVAVLRHGHPHAKHLDLAAYAALPHILISRRGRLTDPVDTVLETHALQRRVLASVGTTAAAAHVIAHGDAVLTAAELTWRPLLRAFELVGVPLPFSLPAPPVICCWHQRYDTDPAHSWLRDRVSAAFSTVLADDQAPLG
ncbi:LysR family transcriptional regulator [Actinoplanes sp. SE50]|uniref:LysR substrate-binding domain-containing protein n=1 Tax=unclassified Actinoplanes TaxID=2626549 RepID=UPI00023ECCD8|nr:MULTISPECIES: LysR substrate-binding domain-containing protein [unclassified Actinoplanes]AEV84848.1 Nodulation protein D [Actinoplanes sp. SE50/110]ATO83239.1 LysR family transcriptional regulator [Actinoplanes sp. SE50]SLM00646.1 LysR-family transcriptional regulator [Actinoplanes sp. SE50/110]